MKKKKVCLPINDKLNLEAVIRKVLGSPEQLTSQVGVWHPATWDLFLPVTKNMTRPSGVTCAVVPAASFLVQIPAKEVGLSLNSSPPPHKIRAQDSRLHQPPALLNPPATMLRPSPPERSQNVPRVRNQLSLRSRQKGEQTSTQGTNTQSVWPVASPARLGSPPSLL